jgi:epoxide hydrolase-like predicted phosphatase
VLFGLLLYNIIMKEGPIRAVVFDFGGVLAEEGFRDGLTDLARQQGLDPVAVHKAAYEAIYESGYIIGRGTAEAFWHILQDKTGITGDLKTLFFAIAARFALRPRMFAMVRALRSQGYITAILSDQTEWLDRLDAKLHFFQDFDNVYNSFHLGKGKRDPSVFDDVVGDLGLAPEKVIFVDDNQDNVERAQSRGIKALLFLNEDQCLKDLEALLGHPITQGWGAEKKQKTLSAGVIVVRREKGDWRYLLLRSYNYWDFSKGIVEAGEEPRAAARREVAEETGLQDLVFTWGHDFRETVPYGPGKVARYYVAETRQATVILQISKELGRPEHHAYSWLSYGEARKLLAPRVQPILDWAHALISTEDA